jgi:WD40 repeat protein
MGTPSYMAPEQASGRAHEAGPAADIYALGAILYECLTGQPPFKGRTVVETLDQVRTREPVPPSRVARSGARATTVPLDLETICLKCLRKEPEERYASAAELADDLARYQRGEPIRARPVGGIERCVKWVKRNPVVAGAAAVVVLALAVGATYSYLQYRKTEAALASEKERGEERDKANKNLEYQLGISNMVLASAAYDNRDVVFAVERLEKVPEAQRGWEWRYLKQQTRGGLFTLYGHTDSVLRVAFSPDGERIVTGTRKEVKVWDARTGTTVFELTGTAMLELKNRFEESQLFSLGGTRLATAGRDNTARLWDARTGKLQGELKHTSPLVRVVLSPDGSRVATVCADGMVKVWDAATGNPQGEFKGTRARAALCAAFSPDSTRLCIGPVENQKALVCDAGTGKPLLELSECKGSRRFAFSPDGSRIVAGASLSPGPATRQATVWDAEKGGPPLFALKDRRPISVNGPRDVTACMAVSPDGARIVTGHGWDEKALVWDARTGMSLFSLKGRRGPKTTQDFHMGVGEGEQSAAFSPDGTRIVTVGGQSGAHEATVWDAQTGAELLVLTGHTNQVLCAAFSPDGTHIVTGCMDGTAKVWDARTGTPRLEMNAHRGELDKPGQEVQARAWYCVAVSPDSTRILSGGGEPEKPGAATVWDARTGKALLELKGLKGTLASVAFSQDGTRIVTGGYIQNGRDEQGITWTGEVKVWDVWTGASLLELKGFKEGVNSIALSRDGARIVTAGSGPKHDGCTTEVKVWDARTGAVLLDLTQPDPAAGVGFQGLRGASVAFSPDGTRFVAGGLKWLGPVANWATVRDAATGAELFELKGHRSPVQCVAYSPDGTRLVTGGGDLDHRALVWDAETGTPLPFELKGHTSAVLCVAFSPDGSRIVTGSVDRTVRVWDARSGTALLELKGFAERVTSVAFSPDGTRIVTGDVLGAVTVWDARSVQPPPIVKGHTGFIRTMAFSPDDTRLVTGSLNELKVWDVRTGAILLDLKGHESSVESVAFSPDGTQIVSGAWDFGTKPGEVKVWDARTGTPQRELKWEWQTGKVWDARTGEALLELKGPPETLRSVSLSPDGTRLVTHSDDGTAKVWDARTGEALIELKAGPSTMRTVWFSPDGTRLVTFGRDGPKVWDARTGKELPGVALPNTVAKERLSHDGRVFAQVDGDHVELVPLQPDEEELAYRRLHTQPNVGRYRESYRAARAAQDEFAAGFYLKLLPPAEQKLLTAEAAAEREIAAGRTQDALVHLAVVSAARPEDTELALKVAALQAWFGQDKDLAETCRRGLASARNTTVPETADRVAKGCCLRPSTDKAQLAAALALARQAVQLGNDNPNLPWFQMSLGMTEYRSGHFAEADAALTAATTGANNNRHLAGPAAFFRAMILFQQGKPDEACKLATEAAKMVALPRDEKNPLASTPPRVPPTHDDLILWLAYKEAKALIQWETPRK